MNDNYIILNSNCVPVKGAVRATLCDLQIGKYYFVPNTLVDVLEHCRSHTVSQIYSEFGSDNKDILDNYFQFVTEKGLAIETSIPDQFPKISEKWSHPGKVSNSIIDFREEFFDSIDYQTILSELSRLGCSTIQFRAFSMFNKSRIPHLLDLLSNSRVHDIKFAIPHNVYNLDELQDFVKENARISEVVIFGSPEYREEKVSGALLLFIRKKDLSPQSCGTICASNFSINIPHYTEAINHNSCLNKKISVDEIGNIKSCPSSLVVFGNVFENTLDEVLQKGDVKQAWNITKDQVEVCKDCEFRYICTDCRVFTEDSTALFAKPKKCGYDPYKATWSDDDKSLTMLHADE